MFILKFKLKSNADYTKAFRWVDKKGQPIDLTGSAMMMDVKRTAKDPDALLTLSTGNGLIEYTKPLEGEFTLSFPRNRLAPGTYVFDLLVERDGLRPALAEGSIEVQRGITR